MITNNIEKSIHPLVSVIVPIYKVERWLKKCIDSIIQQTYTNLEIILIDDGSPDACPAICDEYAIKDKRVKVFHKENGGSVSARKYGIERATGVYLFWVDGDDWLCTDTLGKMVKNAESTKSDIVWCDVLGVHNEYSIVANLNYVEKSSEMLHLILEGKNSAWLWNKLIRIDYYNSLHIHYAIGDDMLEDLYQSVQLLAGKPRMSYVAEPLYCYNRTNTEAFTAASEEVIMKRGMPNIIHTYDFLQKRGIFEIYKESFAHQAMRLKTTYMLSGNIDEARNILPFAHKIPQAYPVYGLVRNIFYEAFNGGVLGKWLIKVYLFLKRKE